MPEQEKRLIIHPLEQRLLKRCEGSIDDLLMEEGEPIPFLVYICAPLRPTTRKSAFQHIIEAVYAASQIEGAMYKGRKVITFIPHVEILKIHNELVAPGKRTLALLLGEGAMAYRDTIIRVGRRISEGMRIEISSGEEIGIPVMSFSGFKKKLTNLPSETQIQETFAKIIKSLPPEIFTKELTQRKSRTRSERAKTKTRSDLEREAGIL